MFARIITYLQAFYNRNRLPIRARNMTLRLFFHSDELKANVEVLECTPHENEFAVILRATLFHPQGGGQPCDTGWIGESQVLRVVQDPERIIHFVDQPVKTGMTPIR